MQGLSAETMARTASHRCGGPPRSCPGRGRPRPDAGACRGPCPLPGCPAPGARPAAPARAGPAPPCGPPGRVARCRTPVEHGGEDGIKEGHLFARGYEHHAAGPVELPTLGEGGSGGAPRPAAARSGDVASPALRIAVTNAADKAAASTRGGRGGAVVLGGAVGFTHRCPPQARPRRGSSTSSTSSRFSTSEQLTFAR